MELTDYLKSLPSEKARKAFAKRCNTTLPYMRRVLYSGGDRQFGSDLCIEIERESDGSVKCETLRNDVDWAYIRSTKKVAA